MATEPTRLSDTTFTEHTAQTDTEEANIPTEAAEVDTVGEQRVEPETASDQRVPSAPPVPHMPTHISPSVTPPTTTQETTVLAPDTSEVTTNKPPHSHNPLTPNKHKSKSWPRQHTVKGPAKRGKVPKKAQPHPHWSRASRQTSRARALPKHLEDFDTHTRTRVRASAYHVDTISLESLDEVITDHVQRIEAEHVKWETYPQAHHATSAPQAFHAVTLPQHREANFIATLPKATQAIANIIYGHTGPGEANNATLNLDEHGKKLTYAKAVAGPNQAHWHVADEVEIDRLIISSTLNAMHLHDQPEDRRKDTTYYNPQTKEKMDIEDNKTYRVRGTAGGNKINYPGEVSAATAEMETVKILIQSVVSDQKRELQEKQQITTDWITLDIKDYYLGAPLERPEYIRIPRRFIPDKSMDKHNLHQYLDHKDSILFRIDKCMYGLPQAGFLSQKRLIAHLSQHGYHQQEHVPCLFSHANGITFTLVVDDFGVKIPNKAAAEHLINVLEKEYKLHKDWKGAKYLGFDINIKPGYAAILDMPNYVPKMLEQFFPGQTLKGKLSPAVYTAPTYGAKQQYATTDDTATLSPEDTKRVQEIVGSALYYARAIDCTMLPATTHASSRQAKPTQAVLKSTEDILQYAAAYPYNQLVLYACDMILYIQSDASYLSRPGGKSVAGGIFYLGDKDRPEVINGPILALSSAIDVVVAAVSEAEYAACFQNAQRGAHLRTTLTALGYVQPPTPIQLDNACATGLANDTIKAKKSKSIDMRFHWVRDRVKQGQFYVFWKPGKENLADFFTKPLPVHEHQRVMKQLVRTPKQPSISNRKKSERSAIHWAKRHENFSGNNAPHDTSEPKSATRQQWDAKLTDQQSLAHNARTIFPHQKWNSSQLPHAKSVVRGCIDTICHMPHDAA